MKGDISRFVTTHGIDSVFSGDGNFVVFSRVGHFAVVQLLLSQDVVVVFFNESSTEIIY